MSQFFALVPLAQVGQTQPAANAPADAPAANPEATKTTVQDAGAAAADAAKTAASSTSQPGAPLKPQEAPGGLFSSLGSFLPLILMFVLLYFILFRGQRKEEKKRKAMIAEMKKGDRVMTIGGLVARVASIDGDEVTLKIDESANVKAVYTKAAIQRVLSGDEKPK